MRIARKKYNPALIYDWLDSKSPRHDCTFPKPFKIGKSTNAWFEHDVDRWLILRSQS
ncbi:helix-turn-helix transcriptional regulator [Aeromonas caviae]|uniref:helix-turn-helix transcriptional regulator n=1 Tax=Aeromonas caviae TaxID=648 RepID=UPI0023AA65E9|nr:AlpA family phage regulatory protein [Aeromonas caviae]WEE20646.1 AlpA family phage regulatory protein [Aeromonas caviae]